MSIRYRTQYSVRSDTDVKLVLMYFLLILCIGPIYIDELEDILDDFMLSLNTEVDDGSIEEVIPLSLFEPLIVLLVQIGDMIDVKYLSNKNSTVPLNFSFISLHFKGFRFDHSKIYY